MIKPFFHEMTLKIKLRVSLEFLVEIFYFCRYELRFCFYQTKVVVITIVQLQPTKTELRFCISSNPAWGVSEIQNGEDI